MNNHEDKSEDARLLGYVETFVPDFSKRLEKELRRRGLWERALSVGFVK